jgi:hypothetical protein
MPPHWSLTADPRSTWNAQPQSYDEALLQVPACHATSYRWHDGPSAGVHGVDLTNGKLTATVLPTRGMGLHQIQYGDWRIGWKSPVRGPVNPALVPLLDASGLGWLDGFDELLCRCGLYSNGAPEFAANGSLVYPLHGRIANTPAHAVELASDPAGKTISLSGTMDESRFHFQKLRLRSTVTLPAGEARLSILDEVTNFSDLTGEMELLYHINFGEPLLDAGSTIIAAAKRVVPRNPHSAGDVAAWDKVGPQHPTKPEQVYFLEPIADREGRATVLLRNAAGTRGVSVGFKLQQLPFFTLWKNTAPSADGYVAGLEPGINFPNTRTFEAEHGRVKKLAAGETARFELELAFYNTAPEVQAIEQQIRNLQGSTAPELHEQPLAEWCS